MDTENRTHKIICHDCGGNGYRRDCYGEVYQCKNCKSQGEITFTEEEMLENIDDAGAISHPKQRPRYPGYKQPYACNPLDLYALKQQ